MLREGAVAAIIQWMAIDDIELPGKSGQSRACSDTEHVGQRSSAPDWSHPVIANGKLYLRDQSLLLCYDIKAK